MDSSKQLDSNMIRNPEGWPNWPLLPVKERIEAGIVHHGRKFGVIAHFSVTGSPYRLWFYEDQNLFTFNSEAESVPIKDVEEFVKGWQVD